MRGRCLFDETTAGLPVTSEPVGPYVSIDRVARVTAELPEADGRSARYVVPVAKCACAGRTLFTFSGGVRAVGGGSGRAVRVEVGLLYRGEGAVTSLCVRGQT